MQAIVVLDEMRERHRYEVGRTQPRHAVESGVHAATAWPDTAPSSTPVVEENGQGAIGAGSAGGGVDNLVWDGRVLATSPLQGFDLPRSVLRIPPFTAAWELFQCLVPEAPTGPQGGGRRLHRRYERKASHFLAFTSIACTLICYRRLAQADDF
ncbi:hypothetical protein [Streptomyces coeruleorubidus]|uniref:hypothetical protein n=1 Tax=Streptomyces coeruleorubidus TaxID=116188 RepID=UPI0033B7B8BA